MRQRKIMVLVNLDKPQGTLIQNAVNLANTLNARVLLFYVRKAAEIVEYENTFSAIRTLTETHVSVEKQMEELVKPFAKQAKVNIQTQFAFGNVKNEIAAKLDEYKPDLVMVGKRATVRLPWAGDQLTEYLMKTYQGEILVSSKDHVLEPNEHLSLGMLDQTGKDTPRGFSEVFMEFSKQPLKRFRIQETGKTSSQTSNSQREVEYVFAQSTDAIKNLSKYVVKNNVHLLCVNRNTPGKDSQNNPINIKEVMQHLPVSLLMAGNEPS